MAFTVADGLVRLVVDEKELSRSVSGASGTAGATAAGTAGRTLGQRFSGAFQKVAYAGAATAGAVLATSIGKASGFDEQLRIINTVAKVSDQALSDIGKSILEVSKETGKATDDLTAGFYDLVSAGVPAEKAIAVLRTSAILATGALGTTAEAVDLMTSALNAYELGADKATYVSDVFAQAVADGKVTVAELGGSISQIAPLAASAGISLEEVAAAAAVMTAKGAPVAEAFTSMRQAISALLTPNETLNEIQTKTGQTWAELAAEKGLSVALEELREQTNGNDEAFAKALGSTQAYQFALASTGENAADFAGELEKITTEAGNGGVALSQYEEVMKSASAQGRRLTAELGAAAITIGGPFVSSLGAVLVAVGPMGQGLAGAAAGAGLLKGALGGVGGLLKRLVGPATAGASAILSLGEALGAGIGRLPGVPAIKAGATKLGSFLGSTAGKVMAAGLAVILVAEVIATYNRIKGELAEQTKEIAGNVSTQLTSGTTAQLEQSQAALKTAMERLAHEARGGNVLALDPLKEIVAQYNAVTTELNGRFDASAREAAYAAAHGLEAGKPVIARAAADLAAEIPSGLQKGSAMVAAAAREFLARPIGEQLVAFGPEGLRAGASVALELAAGLRSNRSGVDQAMAQLREDMKNAMSPSKIIGRDIGLLVGKTIAKGLRSSDPIVKKQAEGTRALIEAELIETVKAGGKAGEKIQAELEAKLKSKDPDVRAQAQRTKSLIDAALRASPGKNPGDVIGDQLASDLASSNTTLGRTAYALGRTIAKNLLRGVTGTGVSVSPIYTGPTTIGGKPIPVFEKGAWRTEEGLAYLHRDEMVVPRRESEAIRSGTGAIGNLGLAGSAAPNVTLVMPDARNRDPFDVLERARRLAGFGAFTPRALAAPSR